MKTLQKEFLRSYYSTGFVKKSWRDKVEVTANHFKESALSPGDLGWAQGGETALGQTEDIKQWQESLPAKETQLWINPFCLTVLCTREGQRKEPRKRPRKTAVGDCSGSSKAVSSLQLCMEVGATTGSCQLLYLLDCHYTALLKDPRRPQ